MPYDFREAEPRWQQWWEQQGIYRFDPKSKAPVYSVDTPPPTVSGRMHMGHAFSYTQADILVRYHRMQGENVFFPFGFDDNGLATERFVEKKCNVLSTQMSRRDFVALCLQATKEAEAEMEKDWRSLGTSYDWSIVYRTVDDWCTKTSQRSFLELLQMKRAYQKEAPIMWCTECRTAIAQVELEDKETDSQFVHMQFEAEGGEKLTIATTRPEMMAACVAIFVHPHDKMHKHLIGKAVTLPLYGRTVKVLANPGVDMSVGSGIVYACTFGDVADMEWQATFRLPIIEIIGKDGVMNEKAGPYAGMKVKEARKAIIADLERMGLVVKKEPIKHTVNAHERCSTEVEYLSTRQWFIQYLDLKKEFLRAGKKIRWFPGHMRSRYDNWVNGLKWDWCISRQRYFGVPFPVWYCKGCGARKAAEDSQLPVDPLEDRPLTPCGCGSAEFEPEKDVMDTWATSSLTPQIALRWREDTEFFRKMYPMSLRTQAHDIISFWLFNTVVKGVLHHKKVPWKDAMIHGWALDPKGKKMSKSKGNVIEPKDMLNKYGADALRFWAASSKLGEDLWFSEREFVAGQKTITKLWNAARFSASHLADYQERKHKLEPMDRWMLSKLHRVIKSSTEALDSYEHVRLKLDTEKLFWHDFCDNYLEFVKERLYREKSSKSSLESYQAAQYTLHTTMLSLLKLLAPILPHITEQLYQDYFASRDGAKSIHASRWPVADDKLISPEAEELGDLAVEVVSSVRKHKSEHQKSLKADVKRLTIDCDAATRQKVERMRKDICAAGKVKEIAYGDETSRLSGKKGLKIGVEL